MLPITPHPYVFQRKRQDSNLKPILRPLSETGLEPAGHSSERMRFVVGEFLQLRPIHAQFPHTSLFCGTDRIRTDVSGFSDQALQGSPTVSATVPCEFSMGSCLSNPMKILNGLLTSVTGRFRSDYLLLHKQTLSQLSYSHHIKNKNPNSCEVRTEYFYLFIILQSFV